MLFNSPAFLLVFLPVTLLGFFLVGARHRRLAALWLALASLAFYAVWNPRLVGLLLASIVVNYGFGIGLARAGRARRSPLLAVAVALNLVVLGVFKYADFFIVTLSDLTGASLPLAHIVLPLGISFFTFTQIAFLVDVSRGIAAEYDFVHYLLFVTYFPHLIAGPVLHHKQMMPQFESTATYRFDAASFTRGSSIFLIGLAKKVVIADALAPFAAPLFDAADRGTQITFFDGWAGALSYTFQLYFDFSGYSDMAVGLSLLMGVRLPVNFDSPYRSRNIIDFWRRWHITLSSFLRDYLYIPLGGNRLGPARRHLNLLATMVLGGLWHGANWTFVAWGALHGSLLIVNHGWRSLWGDFTWPARWLGAMGRMSSILLTFLAVVAGWVIFRSSSMQGAGRIFTGMSGVNGFVLPAQVAGMIPGLHRVVEVVGNMPLLGGGSVMGVFEQVSLVLLAAILCFAFPPTLRMSPRLQLAAIVSSIGFVIQGVFFGRAPSPFLYFQF